MWSLLLTIALAQSTDGVAVDEQLMLYDILLDQSLSAHPLLQTRELNTYAKSHQERSGGEARYWSAVTSYLHSPVSTDGALLSGEHLSNAQANLRSCIAQSADSRDLCGRLLTTVELGQSAVSEIPTVWSFSPSNNGPAEHGVIHPWEAQSEGSLKIVEQDDNHLLRWQTKTSTQVRDMLRIGIKTPDMTGIRFDIRTSDPVYLRLSAVDVYGTVWRRRSGDIEIDAGKTTQLRSLLDEFTLFSATEQRLAAENIHYLVIEDATAVNSYRNTPSTIFIDNVAVF